MAESKAGAVKGFAKEFREFIMRGSVIDMAIGIIVGGVFGKIVTSLVNDVLMPPIGLLLAKVDFRALEWTIYGPDVKIRYGAFLNTVIDFVITAFVIFLVIKVINRMRRTAPPPPAPETTRECPRCLSAIPKKASRCAHCTSDVQPLEA